MRYAKERAPQYRQPAVTVAAEMQVVSARKARQRKRVILIIQFSQRDVGRHRIKDESPFVKLRINILGVLKKYRQKLEFYLWIILIQGPFISYTQ